MSLFYLLISSIILISTFGSWIPKNILKSFPKMSSESLFALNIDFPSWNSLSNQVLQTKKRKELQNQYNLREQGLGNPHVDAEIRLFDTDLNTEPRLTLFRDSAAWCPYCQKVWMFIEEKKIPYRIVKINMRSYGDKPKEFLQLVPNFTSCNYFRWNSSN